MSKSERNEFWPGGKRRKFLGGRKSIGIIEFVVLVIMEEPDTPALDIYLEVRANRVRCSLDYIRNVRSMVVSTMLEMQRQGLTTRKLIPDK